MVRSKSRQPVHSSQRRSRSCSSSSTEDSDTNENENRTNASSSSRNRPTTSQPSTASTSNSNKRITNAAARNRVKKRPPNVPFRLKHLHPILTASKKTLREMRRLQNSTDTLIPRLPFQRVVREIMQNFCRNRETQRIQTAALQALHESAEMYVTQLMEDAYFCALHAKRKTLRIVDIQCVRRIRGIEDIINH